MVDMGLWILIAITILAILCNVLAMKKYPCRYRGRSVGFGAGVFESVIQHTKYANGINDGDPDWPKTTTTTAQLH